MSEVGQIELPHLHWHLTRIGTLYNQPNKTLITGPWNALDGALRLLFSNSALWQIESDVDQRHFWQQVTNAVIFTENCNGPMSQKARKVIEERPLHIQHIIYSGVQ